MGVGGMRKIAGAGGWTPTWVRMSYCRARYPRAAPCARPGGARRFTPQHYHCVTCSPASCAHRFQEVFSQDESRAPRMWGARDDVPAIAAAARLAAANVLAQLAVIRPPPGEGGKAQQGEQGERDGGERGGGVCRC